MDHHHGGNRDNTGAIYGKSSFSGPSTIGGVHHNYYQGGFAEPKPKPRPFSVIPFRKNADFVDRENMMEQIDAKRSKQGARIALVGFGGAGKTQLAAQYAYWLKEKAPGTWVFWIHASNEAMFMQSCSDIVRRLGLVVADDKPVHILEVFEDWLNAEANGDWVMIIDNADDMAILGRNDTLGVRDSRSPAAGSIANFLLTPYGCMLFTSRKKDIVLGLAGDSCHIISIGPMTETEGLTLLEKKFGPSNDNVDDKIALLKVLDYIPLAITQAAAYINRRKPRISVPWYLEKFRGNDKNKATLLQQEERDVFRKQSGHESNSVLITWQVSFDQIQEELPPAADLLSMMSFFNPQSIPGFVLNDSLKREPIESERDDVSSLDLELQFAENVKVLQDYCLISVEADGDTFSMHRLVQLSVKNWLGKQAKLKHWSCKFFSTLYIHLPPADLSDLKTHEALLSHAEEAAALEPDRDSLPSTFEWSSILFHAAWYADVIGRHELAETLARKASIVQEEVAGSEDLDTLLMLSTLACALNNQGKHEAAEEVQRRVVAGTEKSLGKNHPRTLISLCQLTDILQFTDLYGDETIVISQLVLPELQALLADQNLDDFDRRKIESNIPSLLCTLGMWDEFEKLNRQRLDCNQKLLGEDHPLALEDMHALGLALYEQQKYEEASLFLSQSLLGRRKIYGDVHEKTLESIRLLARILDAMGDFKNAASCFYEVLSREKEIYGVNHPYTQQTEEDYNYCLLVLNLDNIAISESTDNAESTERRSLDYLTPEVLIDRQSGTDRNPESSGRITDPSTSRAHVSQTGPSRLENRSTHLGRSPRRWDRRTTAGTRMSNTERRKRTNDGKKRSKDKDASHDTRRSKDRQKNGQKTRAELGKRQPEGDTRGSQVGLDKQQPQSKQMHRKRVKQQGSCVCS